MLLTAIETVFKKKREHPEEDASRIKDSVCAAKSCEPACGADAGIFMGESFLGRDVGGLRGDSHPIVARFSRL